MNWRTILVGYFAVLEIAHLLVLSGAGWRVMQTGAFGFPAPPPAAGWSEQSLPFLLATGVVDAINVFIALIFVYRFFKQKPGWPIWAAVSLTAAVYSAVVFVWGTVTSGAWARHPVAYGGIAAAFAPVGLLILHLLFRKNPHH